MAKKPKSPTEEVDEAADSLDIPEFLRRSKTSAPSFHDPAHTTPGVKEGPKPSHDKPKGLSEEEFQALKQKLAPERVSKPKPDKEPRPPRVRRPKPPADTFKLADWARDAKLDPRHVRRVARAISPELSKLYAEGLKYVFDNKLKDQVAKMIQDGLANESKRTVKVNHAPRRHTPDIPPPTETVWSGGKSKQVPPPATTNGKEELRKEAVKAVKKHGKRNITKAPAAKARRK